MLHTDDYGFHSKPGGGVHNLFQHCDHALATLQTESLLGWPFRREVLLQAIG